MYIYQTQDPVILINFCSRTKSLIPTKQDFKNICQNSFIHNSQNWKEPKSPSTEEKQAWRQYTDRMKSTEHGQNYASITGVGGAGLTEKCELYMIPLKNF